MMPMTPMYSECRDAAVQLMVGEVKGEQPLSFMLKDSARVAAPIPPEKVPREVRPVESQLSIAHITQVQTALKRTTHIVAKIIRS